MATGYQVFETALGWCAAARSDRGLCGFVLPMPTSEEVEATIRVHAGCERRILSGMKRLVRKVQRYFEGKEIGFDIALDLERGTPFQRRVWLAVAGIPYGRTRTYGEIAREIGRPKAMRAVGGAVGANPVPLIVPCHRVVAADGLLGGFSAAGGVALKQAMLEIEGIPLGGPRRAR
jgi:methylated-DNA-[protein]-cysteine S-methyltransferase